MTSELDLIAIRWLLRDIRAERLGWSALKESDLRQLVDSGFVVVHDGVPTVTSAGYEILGEADLSGFKPSAPSRTLTSTDLSETHPAAQQSREEIEAAMHAIMNRRPTR